MRLASLALLPLAILVPATGCESRLGKPKPALWSPMDAGANHWIRHGSIELTIENMGLELLSLRTPDGKESKAEAFVVTTRTRIAHGDLSGPTVVLLPYQPSKSSTIGGPIFLEDDEGNLYDALRGFEHVVGWRGKEAILTEEEPELVDRLVFDPQAAEANDLTISIPSHCRVRDMKGREVPQPTDRPPFRFRLLKWMWEQKETAPPPRPVPVSQL